MGMTRSLTVIETNSVNTKESRQRRRPLNDLSQVNKVEFVAEYESDFKPPDFTIKELRQAIPAHLFEKNLLTSSLYAAANVSYMAILFYLATCIEDNLYDYVQMIAWPSYWYLQGVGAVGLWVLAHECGHQSFSKYKTLNDGIGFLFHTVVLVPYHSFRISHSQHHASTANMKGDQLFVPRTRSEFKSSSSGGSTSLWMEAIEDTPIYHMGLMIAMLLFAWPAYLITHISGQSYPTFTSHFLPNSAIFKERHRSQVITSNVGIVLWLSLLTYIGAQTSFWVVTKYYVMPYVVLNAWLLTFGILQHTDVYVPHYSSESWNFVRGALSTVDRDFGWFLNHAFHHIHDSHVAHHLFSQMPFYNAVKATPYLKEVLGEYYLYDETPVWKALWRVVRHCRYVDDDGEVLFYRSS